MDEAASDLFKKSLKKNGFSFTAVRLHVFRAIYKQPISQKDLIAELKPIADRVSVYRSVKLFLDLGLIQKINSVGGDKLEIGDSFSKHHHHFICLSCGYIVNINSSEIERYINRLSAKKLKPIS